jgi:peptidoglycan hydrolase-like protein with peptidoglycan-binding domain
MVAEMIDRVFENPAMSGGLMVVALTATAIVSNAMFLQSGHHPDPLFMTRPAAVHQAPKAPVAIPVLRPRPDSAQLPAPVLVPLPRPSPARAQPAVAAPEPPAVDPMVQLTTDIQRELARLGLYSGAIDGVTGPRTASAISAYERAAGRRATGQATEELLKAMKAPLPPRDVQASGAADPQAAATAAELDQREEARAASIAAEQQARADARMHQNYRIVQGALNRIGYGPITVDGQPSQETADAVRRFELDNGLPIGGEATDALIGHMIAIGAIKAT